MAIRTRLYLLFGVMLIIILAAGVKSWQTVTAYGDFNTSARQLLHNALQAEKVITLTYRHVDYVRTLSAGDDPADVADYEDKVLRQLKALEGRADHSEEKKLLRELRRDYEELADLLYGVAEVRTDPDPVPGQPTDNLLSELRLAQSGVEASANQLVRHYDRKLVSQVAASGETGFRAQLGIFVASLLTALILTTLLLAVGRWVLSPLERLGAAAERIGSGDLEHRLTDLGKDEIGTLGRSFNEMAMKLRQHQKRLIEARELAIIGAMSSSVAHGMRNPLAGIRVAAQFLTGALPRDHPSRERVQDIIDEVDRMTRRIGALLDFGRPSEIKPETASLRDLIAFGVREAQATLDPHGIVVTVDNSTDDVHVNADPDRIVQIIAEILTNAALHGGTDIPVTISAHRRPEEGDRAPMVVLSIQDRGKGMDSGALAQAFDLFFTTREGGSGMGLACARRIAELHGGYMEMHSTPGQGTRVILALPAATGPGATPPDVAPAV